MKRDSEKERQLSDAPCWEESHSAAWSESSLCPAQERLRPSFQDTVASPAQVTWGSAAQHTDTSSRETASATRQAGRAVGRKLLAAGDVRPQAGYTQSRDSVTAAPEEDGVLSPAWNVEESHSDEDLRGDRLSPAHGEVEENSSLVKMGRWWPRLTWQSLRLTKGGKLTSGLIVLWIPGLAPVLPTARALGPS